jgi:hypothetical protein
VLCTIWKYIVLVRIALKTRIGLDASIQYRLVQYISILYITLYNNLLLLYSYNLNPIKNTHLRHVTVHYFSRIVQTEAVFFPYPDVQYVFFTYCTLCKGSNSLVFLLVNYFLIVICNHINLFGI